MERTELDTIADVDLDAVSDQELEAAVGGGLQLPSITCVGLS